jgi:hypothetical protein
MSLVLCVGGTYVRSSCAGVVLAPVLTESSGGAGDCDLIVIGSIATNAAIDTSAKARWNGLPRAQTTSLTPRIDEVLEWVSLFRFRSSINIEWVNSLLSDRHPPFEIGARVFQMDAGGTGPMLAE